jgi:glycosyltransferase involved in cell wall biosynthesis
MSRDATAPRVALVDRFLSPRRLAALYRSADVTVFPYRAEGFGLPILESMACGRPAIVPAFGAALDVCTPASSFLVPARRIAAPVGRTMPFNTLGFEADVDRVDFCEIDPDQLAATLRAVAGASPARLRRVGAAARQRALAFTWDASCETVERALARLERRGPPIRIARARARAAERVRRLDVATSLYVGRSPHGPASNGP